MTERTIEREYSEAIPPQYLDGFAVFMGRRIKVDPRVLIPRPETEILVRTAKDEIELSGKKKSRILDMCTGSGAVAIALAEILPDVKITAADISREALEVAEDNLRHFGFAGRIELAVSDLFSAFGNDSENLFDAIVSNPPYVSDRDFKLLDPWVKAEPAIALFAGEKGMDYLSRICEESPKFLKDGGFLAVEIGYDQYPAVTQKMAECGFSEIKSFKDENGYDRVIMGQKNV
ncbi:MAG: peptide chain release factor N(5)-glutamine methyltransferase [Candidatus Omnitrophota bacterium]